MTKLVFGCFCIYFVMLCILLRMHVHFCCVRFSFSVLSQEIGWEECLRNDLFCVGWDVNLNSVNQSQAKQSIRAALVSVFVAGTRTFVRPRIRS